METEQKMDTRCGHIAENGERCEQEGNPCWLGSAYEEPHEYLCGKHQFEAGYCPGCGLFWGGIESFEFSDHHLCENCESELQEARKDRDNWHEAYLDALREQEPFERLAEAVLMLDGASKYDDIIACRKMARELMQPESKHEKLEILYEEQVS